MRSYRDLAEEAGVTVEAVRDTMGRAERHEIPYTRMYDDFRNPPRPFGPGRYGRAEIAYDVVWVVRDQWGVRSTGMGAHARRPCWPRCAGTHDSGNAAGRGGSRSLES